MEVADATRVHMIVPEQSEHLEFVIESNVLLRLENGFRKIAHKTQLKKRLSLGINSEAATTVTAKTFIADLARWVHLKKDIRMRDEVKKV